MLLSISLKETGVLGWLMVSANEVQIAPSSSCVRSSRVYLGLARIVIFMVYLRLSAKWNNWCTRIPIKNAIRISDLSQYIRYAIVSISRNVMIASFSGDGIVGIWSTYGCAKCLVAFDTIDMCWILGLV